jgi:hypothetical protein
MDAPLGVVLFALVLVEKPPVVKSGGNRAS